MARVVKTNSTNGTMFSNIIFIITLEKMWGVSKRFSMNDLAFWKSYLSWMDEVWEYIDF